MSSFVLMKIFESSPSRYDTSIRIMTCGRITHIYGLLLEHISEKDRVLDIGCGTGALSLAAARKGAFVTGIDINRAMLEIAQKRAKELKLEQSIEFKELGAAEIDKFPDNSFDIVMSGLCFSELSEDEIRYTLRQIQRLLKPSGKLLLADEIIPRKFFKFIIHKIIRFPLQIITMLISQSTTHAIKNLQERVAKSGFGIIFEKKFFLDSFQIIVAKKGNE